MSWNPSSKPVVLGILAVLVFTAGFGSAVTITNDETPVEGQVGTTQTATYVVDELYQNPTYESWMLEGETELTNVTWTVQLLNQAGDVIETTTTDGATFEQSIDIESGTAEVRVKLTGTIPPIANLSYAPPESFLFAELRQVRAGGTSDVIQSFTTHQFTPDSKEARQAIMAAETAVEDAGNPSEATETLQNAISAYEAGNYENAIDLANRAEDQATSVKETNQRNQFLLFGGLGIIAIVVVVGGIMWWYRSRQPSNRL